MRRKLGNLRHKGMELRALQGENRELRDRVERQSAFFKRKMEKEKRSRSVTRASTSSSVGERRCARARLRRLPWIYIHELDEVTQNAGFLCIRSSATPLFPS